VGDGSWMCRCIPLYLDLVASFSCADCFSPRNSVSIDVAGDIIRVYIGLQDSLESICRYAGSLTTGLLEGGMRMHAWYPGDTPLTQNWWKF